MLGEIVEDVCDDDRVNLRVITTSPHYNTDEQAQLEQPIKWAWHRLCGESKFCGATVLHIRMPKKAKSAVLRCTQWFWFHIWSTVFALFSGRNADLVVTVSPPPTITLAAILLKKVFKPPFIYIMWELYPQILVTLGHIKVDSFAHRQLVRLERLTYTSADRIVALHEPMRHAVGHCVPAALEKTVVIPTFADVTHLHPMSEKTSLRDLYNLHDRFVVGYAGNLGTSEDLGVVLDAARVTPDVSYLICGDGTERERLESYCVGHSLQNVIFTGHLPYKMVPEITATADVSLVVLSKGVGDEALPSKVYKVMACGRPILAISSPDSPLANLVESLGVGRVVTDYNAGTLTTVIEEMEADRDRLQQMATKARESAVDRFSRAAVTTEYRNLIFTMAETLEISVAGK